MNALSKALRLVAVVWTVALSCSILRSVLVHLIFATAAGSYEPGGWEAVRQQVEFIRKTNTVVQAACATSLFGIALWLHQRCKPLPKRVLAQIALALSAVYLGLTVYVSIDLFSASSAPVAPDSAELLLRAIVSLTRFSALYGFMGVLLAIGSGPLKGRWPLGRALLLVFAILTLTVTGACVFAWFSTGFVEALAKPLWGWLFVGFTWLPGLCFIVASFWTAGRLRAAAQGPAAKDSVRPAVSGEPLRSLAWAVLVRIGVGVVGQILMMVGMYGRQMVVAQAVLVLMTLIDVVVSIVIITALRRYQRYPAAAVRRGAVGYAIGAIVVGIVLELGVTAAANELFGLADAARRASGPWSMPSFLRIKTLTTVATWGGRLSLLLGLSGLWSLLASVRRTAAWLDSAEFSSGAKSALTLSVVAGLGAVLLSFLANARIHAVGLLAFAGVLLVVAIVLLGIVLSLLFGLARALEGDAEPLPSEQ